MLQACAIPSWACSPFPNSLSIASICQIVLPFFVPQYFLIHFPSFVTDQEYLFPPHQHQHCSINSHCHPNQHCTEPLILATMPNTPKHKCSKQETTSPLVASPLPHSQTPCHPSEEWTEGASHQCTASTLSLSTSSQSPTQQPPSSEWPFMAIPSPNIPTPIMTARLAQQHHLVHPMTQWMPEISANFYPKTYETLCIYCLHPRHSPNCRCRYATNLQ